MDSHICEVEEIVLAWIAIFTSFPSFLNSSFKSHLLRKTPSSPNLQGHHLFRTEVPSDLTNSQPMQSLGGSLASLGRESTMLLWLLYLFISQQWAVKAFISLQQRLNILNSLIQLSKCPESAHMSFSSPLNWLFISVFLIGVSQCLLNELINEFNDCIFY